MASQCGCGLQHLLDEALTLKEQIAEGLQGEIRALKAESARKERRIQSLERRSQSEEMVRPESYMTTSTSLTRLAAHVSSSDDELEVVVAPRRMRVAGARPTTAPTKRTTSKTASYIYRPPFRPGGGSLKSRPEGSQAVVVHRNADGKECFRSTSQMQWERDAHSRSASRSPDNSVKRQRSAFLDPTPSPVPPTTRRFGARPPASRWAGRSGATTVRDSETVTAETRHAELKGLAAARHAEASMGTLFRQLGNLEAQYSEMRGLLQSANAENKRLREQNEQLSVSMMQQRQRMSELKVSAANEKRERAAQQREEMREMEENHIQQVDSLIQAMEVQRRTMQAELEKRVTAGVEEALETLRQEEMKLSTPPGSVTSSVLLCSNQSEWSEEGRLAKVADVEVQTEMAQRTESEVQCTVSTVDVEVSCVQSLMERSSSACVLEVPGYQLEEATQADFKPEPERVVVTVVEPPPPKPTATAETQMPIPRIDRARSKSPRRVQFAAKPTDEEESEHCRLCLLHLSRGVSPPRKCSLHVLPPGAQDQATDHDPLYHRDAFSWVLSPRSEVESELTSGPGVEAVKSCDDHGHDCDLDPVDTVTEKNLAGLDPAAGVSAAQTSGDEGHHEHHGSSALALAPNPLPVPTPRTTQTQEFGVQFAAPSAARAVQTDAVEEDGVVERDTEALGDRPTVITVDTGTQMEESSLVGGATADTESHGATRTGSASDLTASLVATAESTGVESDSDSDCIIMPTVYVQDRHQQTVSVVTVGRDLQCGPGDGDIGAYVRGGVTVALQAGHLSGTTSSEAQAVAAMTTSTVQTVQSTAQQHEVECQMGVEVSLASTGVQVAGDDSEEQGDLRRLIETVDRSWMSLLHASGQRGSLETRASQDVNATMATALEELRRAESRDHALSAVTSLALCTVLAAATEPESKGEAKRQQPPTAIQQRQTTRGSEVQGSANRSTVHGIDWHCSSEGWCKVGLGASSVFCLLQERLAYFGTSSSDDRSAWLTKEMEASLSTALLVLGLDSMGATIDGVFNDAETIPGSGLSVEDFLLLGQKIFKVFSTFDLRVTVDQTRALFDALDSNADGRLDRTEWTRGLSLARQNLSPKLAVSLAHAGCVSARHRLRAQLRRLRTLSDMYADMAAEDPDAMSDSEEHFVVHGGVLCAECSVAIDWMV